VTLQDIADRCGVSLITASRALRNDRRNVSQQNIERISAVAREMGYDASSHHDARRMSLRKHGVRVQSHIVALFMPNLFMEYLYHASLFRGVSSVLLQERYGTLLLDIKQTMEDADLPLVFARGDIDGLITLVKSDEKEMISFVRRVATLHGAPPLPTVNLIEPMEGASVVLADDQGGAYAAARHLLALGHRSIVICTHENYPHQQRLLGYRQAYREAGLPEKELHVLPWDSQPNELLAVLRQYPTITAVQASNDVEAQLIARTLAAQGYRVPEDISLIGYDDTDPLPNGHENILTSVHLPLIEIGLEGARLLLRHITDHDFQPTTVVLPTTLMVRKSTAPP
jgi:LacI family transcriptional regulator